jgi:uncharacterized protein (DUF1501 family)
MRRRNFLKTTSSIAALSLGLNISSPPLFKRRLLAGSALSDKRLIFIFQRGGMDGIHACIPHGDSTYNSSNRPTLYMPPEDSLDLGNGFAALNPSLGSMMDVYNAGELAVIHRVGYEEQSQSHFDSQQYWENGTPRQRDNTEGVFNRFLQFSSTFADNSFPAAAIESSAVVALQGPEPVANFSRPASFTLPGSSARVDKFLGEKPLGGTGSGFLGAYAGPQDAPGKRYRNELYRTGELAAKTVMILREANINPSRYQPQNGAQYPSDEFGTRLKICAELLKETPVQILGVNLNGWDTHAEQSSHINPLLDNLADGVNALSKDLGNLWDDTVVMTMTEFGRTSIENGAFGTDHAFATVMFLAGGGVQGGVYNCDSTNWQNGDLFSSPNGRYLAHRTDYRAIMAEIFKGHFGDSDAVVNQTIPNYATISAADPAFFQPLGLFA